MRGLIDNSVNLGGNQTITGVKSYTSGLNIVSNNITDGATPESGINGTRLNFLDSAGVMIGFMRSVQKAAGDILLQSKAIHDSQGIQLELRSKNDETTDLYCNGPSSTNNTVVTTVSHKYTDVNNIKFGNDLIIQWGKSATPNTVTFSTPYTEIPTVLITQNANGNDQRNVMVHSITTTSFKTYRYSSEVANLEWFSIGI